MIYTYVFPDDRILSGVSWIPRSIFFNTHTRYQLEIKVNLI